MTLHSNTVGGGVHRGLQSADEANEEGESAHCSRYLFQTESFSFKVRVTVLSGVNLASL